MSLREITQLEIHGTRDFLRTGWACPALLVGHRMSETIAAAAEREIGRIKLEWKSQFAKSAHLTNAAF
jgi:hypothetical protein